jgi:hypothetical protein
MKVSNIEEFFVQEGSDERAIYRDEERDELHRRFPHVVVTEGSYPEIDFANRWCWRSFGPPHVKECTDHYSEYPACPLVVATESAKEQMHQSEGGVVKQFQKRYYKAPEPHGHDGMWATFWLGKTDYDYGFMEFCFSRPQDKAVFLAAAPLMGFGENYGDAESIDLEGPAEQT